MNPNYQNSNGGYNSYSNANTDDASSSNSNYGNNYANYEDNSYNNQYNNGNQDYDNSNYIWQNDDMDDQYGTDDASYYDSNSNYKANGSYNGRDEYWGGQAVQNYDDDAGAEVIVEGMDDDDEQWSFKMGELSGKETAAVSVLAVVFSLFLLFLLGCACNFADCCQLYICCGIFGHKNQSTSGDEDPENPIVDGFEA
ncbi:MAG: hypothetical protein SGARI_001147 [Bacillariaceae sp.]